jgi:hypothetical protein
MKLPTPKSSKNFEDRTGRPSLSEFEGYLQEELGGFNELTPEEEALAKKMGWGWKDIMVIRQMNDIMKNPNVDYPLPYRKDYR